MFVKYCYFFIVCSSLLQCAALQPERYFIRTNSYMFASVMDFEVEIVPNTGYGEDNRYGSCALIALGNIKDKYSEGLLTKTRLYNKIENFLTYHSVDKLCAKACVTFEQLKQLVYSLRNDDELVVYVAYCIISFLYDVDIGVFLTSKDYIFRQDGFLHLNTNNIGFHDLKCVLVNIDMHHTEQLKQHTVPIKISNQTPDHTSILKLIQQIIKRHNHVLASAKMILEIIKNLLINYPTFSLKEKKYLFTTLNYCCRSDITPNFKKANKELINEIKNILR